MEDPSVLTLATGCNGSAAWGKLCLQEEQYLSQPLSLNVLNSVQSANP
jgi:hypothetical protein